MPGFRAVFLSDGTETGKRNFFVYADFSWDAFPVLETSSQAKYTLQKTEEKNAYTCSSGIGNSKEYWTLVTTYKSVVDTLSLHAYLNLIFIHSLIEGLFSFYITQA